MDCQTESYSDAEGLRSKIDFSCTTCAEKSWANAGDGPRLLPSSDDDANFYYDAEPCPVLDVEPQSGEVLDLTDVPPLAQDSGPTGLDELILFPVCEPGASHADAEAAPAEPCAASHDPAPGGPGHLAAGPDPSLTAAEQQAHARIEQPRSARPGDPAGWKSMRSINFSSSRLTVIAAALILFTALMEVATTPHAKDGVKVEAPPVAAQPAPREVVEAAPSPSPAPEQVQETAATAPVPAPPAPGPEVAAETTPAPQPPAQVADREIGAGKALFTIQVGAHKEEREANSQAEKLRAAGFEPRVVSVDIPNRGRWYRVQAGNFMDRDEANRFGAQVLSKGAAETFVIAGL